MKRKEPSAKLTPDLIRTILPRLLKEKPDFRHEVVGILAEAFPTRAEFSEIVTELRALREDFNRHAEATDRRFEAVDRRFEAVDRRFEAVDRRFEELIAEMRHGFEVQGRALRELQLHMSALGGRVGYGLEHVVRELVEEFSGQQFASAQKLALTDSEGEVFGVKGAQIEFDLFATDGTAYLVEVKSHLKPGDVLQFHRKVEFATRKLGKPAVRLIIALSMEAEAERVMKDLGIRYLIRSRVEAERA
jgi:hypothetical protein